MENEEARGTGFSSFCTGAGMGGGSEAVRMEGIGGKMSGINILRGAGFEQGWPPVGGKEDCGRIGAGESAQGKPALGRLCDKVSGDCADGDAGQRGNHTWESRWRWR